ncbi:hypothetical protein HLV35_03145 [Eggerthellaceae bacterium zg-997]|nr:hypothetical protein [Eggerthellaceae bacterium zg-997]
MSDYVQLIQTASQFAPEALVGALALFMALFFGRDVKELLASLAAGAKARAGHDAQAIEVIRNNTAALDNNTAALGLAHADREKMVDALSSHDSVTAIRIEKVENELSYLHESVDDAKAGINTILGRLGR